MAILDQHGRPFQVEKIAGKPARAELLDQRKARWQHSVAVGLTPVRLGHILRSADRGDNQDLLTLAIEAPERDNDLFADLQTRSMSVYGAPLRVKPGDTSKRGRKIAETAQELVVNKPEFRWFLRDCMDAVLTSYNVTWPVWDISKTPWTFKEFQRIDPRNFQFDPDTLTTLRMREDGQVDGVPLPAGTIVHYPQIRSGLKLRGGLIRICAVNWLYKTSTIADFMAFAEVYGMPLRIGKFDPDTSSEYEQATLREALVNLGHDAAAMIPTGMEIEILDARRPPSGDNVFSALARYFDNQRTKAILGTSLAAEGSTAGQGKAIAEQRREVRQDIREADALAVGATANEVLRIWKDANYGVDAPDIYLEIDVQPAADIAVFTSAILPWVRETGLSVPEKWLRGRLQIPDPEPGDTMFTAPLLPGAQPGGDHAGAALDGAQRGQPNPAKA